MNEKFHIFSNVAICNFVFPSSEQQVIFFIMHAKGKLTWIWNVCNFLSTLKSWFAGVEVERVELVRVSWNFLCKLEKVRWCWMDGWDDGGTEMKWLWWWWCWQCDSYSACMHNKCVKYNWFCSLHSCHAIRTAISKSSTTTSPPQPPLFCTYQFYMSMKWMNMSMRKRLRLQRFAIN